MKGIKCIGLLTLFITCLLSLSLFSNVSAIENFNVYWRSYQISGQSVVNQSGYNQSGTNVKLLDYVTNETRFLKGFSADFAVSDNSNYTYKTLSVILDMWQPATTGNTFNSNVPYMFAFGSSTGTKSTTTGCSFSNGVNAQGVNNPNHAVWTCKLDWSDGGVVSNAQLIIGTTGDATSDSPNVAFTMSPGNSANSPANADVYAYSLSYTLSGSNDPSVDYLVDISSGINETNSLIQEQIENDNQNTQEIIKSNQHCETSPNLLNLQDGSFNNFNLTSNDINLDTNSITLVANSTVGAQYVIWYPDLTFDPSISYSFSGKAKKINSANSRILLRWQGSNDYSNWSNTTDIYQNYSPVIGNEYSFTSNINGYKYYRFWFYNFATTPVSLGETTSYFDLQMESGPKTSFVPYGEEICKNYNEEISDFLRDDTPPSVDTSSVSNSAGWLPAGPVDSILTLPVVFIQSILSAFNNDLCRDVVLPLPYLENQYLTLPCMRPLLNQMGFLTIYEVVGSVISMFLVYNTLKWLYKFVDDTLTFRENNDFGGIG